MRVRVPPQETIVSAKSMRPRGLSPKREITHAKLPGAKLILPLFHSNLNDIECQLQRRLACHSHTPTGFTSYYSFQKRPFILYHEYFFSYFQKKIFSKRALFTGVILFSIENYRC